MQIKDALTLTNKTVEGKERASVSKGGQSSTTASGAKAEAVADRVELSGRSREMARAHERLAATPAVRQDKVDALREQIQNQQYKVDAQKVAHKMITDFLDEIS